MAEKLKEEIGQKSIVIPETALAVDKILCSFPATDKTYYLFVSHTLYDTAHDY